MTYISFSYDGDGDRHILETVTSDGASITIGFDGLDADWVDVNNYGVEWKAKSDDHKGVYVDFGTKVVPNFVTLSYVITQAENQIETIVEEVEQERREAEAPDAYCKHIARYGY